MNLTYLYAFSLNRQTVLFGVAAICALTALILGIVLLYKNLSSTKKIQNKSNAKKETVSREPKSASLINEEIIAAITAAVLAAEGECDNGIKFRVVSFRRK